MRASKNDRIIRLFINLVSCFKMSGLKGSLIFLCLTGLSLAANSPGEPWTSGEESIVREKLVYFMKSPSKSINELQKSNPEVKKLGTWTRPNLAKVTLNFVNFKDLL